MPLTVQYTVSFRAHGPLSIGRPQALYSYAHMAILVFLNVVLHINASQEEPEAEPFRSFRSLSALHSLRQVRFSDKSASSPVFTLAFFLFGVKSFTLILAIFPIYSWARIRTEHFCNRSAILHSRQTALCRPVCLVSHLSSIGTSHREHQKSACQRSKTFS